MVEENISIIRTYYNIEEEEFEQMVNKKKIRRE